MQRWIEHILLLLQLAMTSYAGDMLAALARVETQSFVRDVPRLYHNRRLSRGELRWSHSFLSNMFQSVHNSLHTKERVFQRHLRNFIQRSRASRSHVNIRRPPRRLQRHRRPEFLDRGVECVCDGVRVDHLVRQQILIKPLGHDRAIVIGHGPAGVLSAAAASIRHAHLPHRCNYTLEARV
jgi:hypothetical protein